MRKNYYRCDKYFHTELVEDLFAVHETVGVVLISGEATSIYGITGTQITLKKTFNVHRQKHQRKGGQSAPRFQRIRLGQINEYVHKIIDEIIAEFTTDGVVNVPAIVLAGAADIRNNVHTNEYLPSHILKVISIDKSLNINDVIINSAEVLTRIIGERSDSEISQWFARINVSDPKYIYGQAEIDAAIKERLVKKLFVVDEKSSLAKLASDNSIEIINVNSGIWYERLMQFGGAGAILWYAV